MEIKDLPDFGKDSERGGKSSNEMASCPNTDTVAQQLLQWYREVEDVDGLVGALAEQLTNDAIEAYKQTIEVNHNFWNVSYSLKYRRLRE